MFMQRILISSSNIRSIGYESQTATLEKDMNKKKDYFIQDMKCNFDVEIGVDMPIDCERNSAETFVLMKRR